MKGPKSKSVSYSGSSNPAFAPAALQAVGNVNQVYSKAQPGLDLLTERLNDSIIPGLQAKSGVSSGVARQGMGFHSDVLSGKYMNGNPWINAILAQTRENIGNSVGGHFSATGRYGSGANQAVMAKQMANAENALRYQNYGDEMNRMGQAASAGQQASLTDMASLLQALGQGAEMPYIGSNNLANSLGALFNGGTSTSTEKGQSPIWGAIGSGIGAAAALASDRRLKTKIRLIRRDPDGLGWYGWRWKADPYGKEEFGVIADEVAKIRPVAYVPNFRGDGFDGVNYAKLAV